MRPNGWGKARDYNGKVTVTGAGESVTFSAHLRKNKKGRVSRYKKTKKAAHGMRYRGNVKPNGMCCCQGRMFRLKEQHV